MLAINFLSDCRSNLWLQFKFSPLVFVCSLLYGCIHGTSPADPVTTPKSVQTFRVCRVFFADHFGNKFVRIRPCFRKDIDQILFMLIFARAHFYAKNWGSNLWKTKDNSSLTARILKPNTDSDSSWKTASESVWTEKNFIHFLWFFLTYMFTRTTCQREKVL
jgi:hypothetical protein